MDAYFKYSSRSAFQFFAFGQRSLGKHAFMSIEPGFVIKGSEITFPWTDTSTLSTIVTLVYAQASTMVGWKSNGHWSIAAGPEFCYEIKKDAQLNYAASNKAEIAGALQLDYHVNETISLGLRLSRSLTPREKIYFTDDNGEDIGTLNIYNQYAMLAARFRLR